MDREPQNHKNNGDGHPLNSSLMSNRWRRTTLNEDYPKGQSSLMKMMLGSKLKQGIDAIADQIATAFNG